MSENHKNYPVSIVWRVSIKAMANAPVPVTADVNIKVWVDLNL